MATTEFGDEAVVTQLPTTTEFGDVAIIPTAPAQADVSALKSIKKSSQAGAFPEELATGEDRLKAALRSILLGVAPPAVSILGGMLETDQQKRIRQNQEGALAEGALSTISAGTTDAAAKLLGVPVEGRESSRMLAPEAFSSGEIGGTALPAGSLGAEATGLKAAITSGARLGSIYGAGSGVSSEILNKENPTVSGALKSGIVQGLGGAALGAGAGLIGGIAIKKLFTPKEVVAAAKLEKVREDAKNVLADIGKFTKQDASKQERLLSGEYTDVLPEVAQFFEPKSGAEGFLDASGKALKARAETFAPVIENGNPFLLSAETLLPQIEQRLSKYLPEATSRASALAKVQGFIENVSPENILNLNSQINDDLIRFYKSATPEASADVAFAKKAVRDTYSEFIRNTLSEAGVDPSVYSKYGLLNEFSDIIGDSFRKEQIGQAATLGKGIVGRFIEGANAPVTSKHGLLVGAEKALAPFTGGEPARINKQINKLFDKITPSKAITPEEQNLIISSAKARRNDLNRISEFGDALKQAEIENAALAATPEELQVELSKLMNESVSIQEAGNVARNIEETYPKSVIQEIKSIRARKTGTVIEDYYHALNASNDPITIGRLETELRRRMDFKKYSKDFPDIREALNIPKPTKGSNLPTKRELGVAQAIEESLQRKQGQSSP